MDRQTEIDAMRDQLLLLQAEGESLHAQALEAQARGERDALIALTERHVVIMREVTALIRCMSLVVTQERERRGGSA